MAIKTLHRLTIPEQKAVFFTHPEYSSWMRLMSENKAALKKAPQLHRRREELLKLAKLYTHKIGFNHSFDKPFEDIIVTGHQGNWHHCGVLAKVFVASKFAKKTNSCGIHLVLDHDVCNTAMMLAEYSKKGILNFKKVAIEQNTQKMPLEFRAVPKAEEITDFIELSTKGQRPFAMKLWSEYTKAGGGKLPAFSNIADLIICLQAKLYSALGIEMLYLPVSVLSRSVCFTDFVISIVANALEFAKVYNKSIFEQIETTEVKPAETIRRLKIDDKEGLIELPFWLVSPAGRRCLLFVYSDNKNEITIGTEMGALGVVDLSNSNATIEQFEKILTKGNYRLRPKAVTLTLFVRLFLADWFIHGIGGSKYESITNHIIERYYQIKELHFGTATATMTLPLTNGNHTVTDKVPELEQRLRELRCNPERFIEESLLEKKAVKNLINKKTELIKMAQKTHNTCSRKQEGGGSETRRISWNRISEVNKKLLRYTAQTTRDLASEIKLSERQELSKRVADYREFFFGLFPEEMLRDTFI